MSIPFAGVFPRRLTLGAPSGAQEIQEIQEVQENAPAGDGWGFSPHRAGQSAGK